MNFKNRNQTRLQSNLIDGHAHLSDMAHPERAVENALTAGVNRIIAVSMNLDSCRKTLSLAEKYPNHVFPAIGYHPWSVTAEDTEDTLLFIAQNLYRCVALGEVGLDYKVKVKKKLQKEVFVKLMGLAVHVHKPVIIHSRFSYQRTYEMAAEAGVEKAVFHWYSGPAEILDKIIASGFYVSATPALAYSSHHQAAMARAPVERILIETDAPVQYGNLSSEPADLRETLFHLSRIKNMPEDQLAAIVTKNTEMFFEL
ncbi:MAG: TatD family hydrolase [Desulfobacterales bacterium]|jgi:TatD DNase family protein|nr:TatD family hydrolase [Desulfobacterales bacterium]